MTSGYQACGGCGARVLRLRGMPQLNYTPDPAGMVAVSFTTPRTARWLAHGEEPTSLEHRHSKHECEPGQELATT